jgi:hypothetical protein
MIAALALTAALGILLGLTSRLPALLLVLTSIAVGGVVSAVALDYPWQQTLAGLLMVQIGYAGSSYWRIRIAFRVAPKPGVGAADTPPFGLDPPDLR